MSLLEWAKKEVEIACKREREAAPEGEWDYGCACYESALKAFESLMDDGHSGYSISLTKNILNRLIDGRALTPIEDTDDIWKECCRSEDCGIKVYQCTRMSSLFKDVYPDGRIIYNDNDRVSCVDIDSPNVYWHSGFVSRIVNEMFPIIMPYAADEKYTVYCKDLLTDRKNGDYDTREILYVVNSKGERTDIHRYFKECEKGWEEIDKGEYAKRYYMHAQRVSKETQVDEDKE